MPKGARGLPRRETFDAPAVLFHRRRRPFGDFGAGEEPGGDPGAPKETLRGDSFRDFHRGRREHHGDEIHRRGDCPAAETRHRQRSGGGVARGPGCEHGIEPERHADQVPRREGLRGFPFADSQPRGPGSLFQKG